MLTDMLIYHFMYRCSQISLFMFLCIDAHTYADLCFYVDAHPYVYVNYAHDLYSIIPLLMMPPLCIVHCDFQLHGSSFIDGCSWSERG